ncbi:DUF1722 domain-containing protein [Marinobacteraceae bacterium S3BR75-40.1]
MTRPPLIFDIDPGFLDDERLSAQMRLVVGLVGNDGGVRREHLPTEWVGYEDALALRLNQLIAEMRLRGEATPEPVPLTEESVIWPAIESESLETQLTYLQQRREQGHQGRIRLPRNDHELWASYKYSILARNHQSYTRFGQRVAARSIPYRQLWLALVHASHVAPRPGGIRNALQHMWGYVSNRSQVDPQRGALMDLLGEIQRLARDEQVSYLINSTALGELAVWSRLEGH